MIYEYVTSKAAKRILFYFRVSLIDKKKHLYP